MWTLTQNVDTHSDCDTHSNCEHSLKLRTLAQTVTLTQNVNSHSECEQSLRL